MLKGECDFCHHFSGLVIVRHILTKEIAVSCDFCKDIQTDHAIGLHEYV